MAPAGSHNNTSVVSLRMEDDTLFLVLSALNFVNRCQHDDAVLWSLYKYLGCKYCSMCTKIDNRYKFWQCTVHMCTIGQSIHTNASLLSTQNKQYFKSNQIWTIFANLVTKVLIFAKILTKIFWPWNFFDISLYKPRLSDSKRERKKENSFKSATFWVRNI